MKYQISVDQDESFKFVATKNTTVNVDHQILKPSFSLDQSSPKSAPLENSSGGHPFDLFSGTSWAGKRNSFD